VFQNRPCLASLSGGLLAWWLDPRSLAPVASDRRSGSAEIHGGCAANLDASAIFNETRRRQPMRFAAELDHTGDTLWS